MIGPDKAALAGNAEWQQGWKVVSSAFVGSMLGAMLFFSHGVFMKPLEQEFGWTRAEVAGAAMIYSASSALAMALVGQLINRFGPRRLVLAGWLLAVSCFASMSLVDGKLPVFYLLWSMLGVSVATSGAVTLSACVIPWFIRHRGAAVSIALTGSNVFGALLPFVAAALIAELGWRMAYFALALGAFALSYPVLLFGFHERKPDHAPKEQGNSHFARPAGRQHHVDSSLREAFRSRAFWVFGIGLVIGGSAMTSQVIHFVPMLTDTGVKPAVAAAVLSINSLIAIPVGFGIGFLLDRIGVRWLTPLIAILPAVSSLLLWSSGSMLTGALAAAAIGLYSGAIMPLLSMFVTRYFGVVHYGSIFAVLMASFAVVQGLGAMVVGAVFDRFGSYSPALAGLAAIAVAGALLLTFIGQPPERTLIRN